MSVFKRLQPLVNHAIRMGGVRYGMGTLSFVPRHNPCRDSDVEKLCTFLTECGIPLVLTGAGVSTESGIPDYRSEGVGLYATSSSRPVLFRDFCRDEDVRRRYWARNFAGWPSFSGRLPNDAHFCLSYLQGLGRIDTIVTQNVDGLHAKAGSHQIIELHGTAHRVVCLTCSYNVSRADFQGVLQRMNPSVHAPSVQRINPDGDVELLQDITKDFKIPSCLECGGIMKPDVVFFGENVPRTRVDLVKDKVKVCDSLIVLGSSLSTFSSYRIVLQAFDAKKPIAIVNIGCTRGDNLCNTKINVRCGELLTRYCNLFIKNV